MRSTDRSDDSSRVLWVLLAALTVFVPLLGQRDIVTSHEARVAQTARHMAVSGWPNAARSVEVQIESRTVSVNPWLVPVINGQIRLQKPPLPYWCTAAMYRLFGMNETTTRLVPALLGIAGVLLIWDLAAAVFGRRAALPAALVWVTTHFVVDEFRKSIADPYLAFFTLLAVWSWVRGGAVRIVVFYVAVALGMLAKGPAMFISLVPAMLLILILRRNRKRRIELVSHIVGLLLFLGIALPWPVYIVRHVPNAIDLWRYESIGEFGENVEKARPWWLYLANCFQLALPWTPLWIAAIVAIVFRRRWWSPRARRRCFALGWFIITLVIFSFANVKKNAYLLPVAAAQTLLVADAIVMLIATARRTALRQLTPVLAGMQAAIGIGFAIGLLVKLWIARASPPILAPSLFALMIAIATIAPIVRRLWGTWLIWQSLAYMLLMVLLVGVYDARSDNARSPRAFAIATAEYSKRSGVPVLVRRLPEEASFYMPLRLTDGSGAGRVLILIDHSRKDPPVDAKLLSDLLGGATVSGFQRVKLYADDGGGRWQLYDVIVQRGVARAS